MLLVIDVQNCFISGSMAVPKGEEVVPIINRLANSFANVVIVQEWHPPGHISFASTHPGKKPFETVKLPYGEQVLWPDHCIQGTDDSRIHSDLNIPHAQLLLRKGFRKTVDSFSAFRDADRKTSTGLAAYLRSRQLTRVFICGLAADFSVGWTAIDARRERFETFVIEDATRGMDVQGSLSKAWDAMNRAGARRIQSGDLAI